MFRFDPIFLTILAITIFYQVIIKVLKILGELQKKVGSIVRKLGAIDRLTDSCLF